MSRHTLSLSKLCSYDPTILSTMFHNVCYQSPIYDDRPQHFRNRFLCIGTVLFAFNRDADVDRTALRRKNLRIQACAGQVDLTGVGGVYLYGGGRPNDLELE